jgi:hypothetical protein
MPPHTRSQRRRQVVQQKGRSAPPSVEKARSAPPSVESIEAVSPPPVTSATVPLASPQVGTQTQRPARAARRVISRATPAPVDYTGDYTAVRRDLRWILIWTVLLFVAMFALRFSGLV